MKNTLNKYNLTFAGMQWFLWTAFAALFSYQVPYLKESGYSEIEIGLLMSVLAFVGIAGPVFWGAVSDRLKSCKWLLVVNLLAGCAAALLVPVVVHSFGLLLSVFITVNLSIGAMPTVLDAWVMRQKSRGAQINYGIIRGAGSLSYALTNIVFGALIARQGMGLMFPVFAGFGCLTALLAFLVRDRPETEIVLAAAPEWTGKEAEPKPLHRNAAFLLFVVAATLLHIGHRAAMNFYPLLLQQAGGNNADLGLANGIMALSEFPVMFLSGFLLKKFKDTTLLLFAMVFYSLRIILFYTIGSVDGLVWSQLANSLSFGIFLPTSVHFIVRITPERLKATALSVASAIYMGIGSFAGSLLGGIVIQNMGLRPMFGMSAILACIATAGFGLILALTRRKGIFNNL